MKQIYMQATIDFMHDMDKDLLRELEEKGIPEVIEYTSKKGELTRYYKYIEIE